MDYFSLRYKSGLRIEGVTQEAMTDPSFLGMLLSQRLEAEVHKVEVLYDALLPALAGKPLPEAIADTGDDPAAEWRTPARSRTSSYRCVLESMRWVNHCETEGRFVIVVV